MITWATTVLHSFKLEGEYRDRQTQTDTETKQEVYQAQYCAIMRQLVPTTFTSNINIVHS